MDSTADTKGKNVIFPCNRCARRRDRKIYDISRAGSFVLFDACYRGGFQHAAFPWIIETCKGDMLGAVVKPELLDPGLLAALECTAFNQGLVVPVIYYPLFFSVTGALQGLSAWESLQRARSQFIPLTLRNWVFWVPAQVAQFALLPEELQVPYTCVMGLVWNIILSSQAGDARAEDEGARAQTAGCVKSKAYSQDGAKKKKTTTRMRVKKEEESNV